MARNRARLDSGGPTFILLTPLDVPEHFPRRRRNSHAVPFHPGPRTPWCAAVGQWVPVRTTPHRRASRPTATLSSLRARAPPGVPTTFPYGSPQTPCDSAGRPSPPATAMRGRAPCAPEKRVNKILRIGARASRVLKETCEHERRNAALQHDLPASLQRNDCDAYGTL